MLWWLPGWFHKSSGQHPASSCGERCAWNMRAALLVRARSLWSRAQSWVRPRINFQDLGDRFLAWLGKIDPVCWINIKRQHSPISLPILRTHKLPHQWIVCVYKICRFYYAPRVRTPSRICFPRLEISNLFVCIMYHKFLRLNWAPWYTNNTPRQWFFK